MEGEAALFWRFCNWLVSAIKASFRKARLLIRAFSNSLVICPSIRVDSRAFGP